MTILYDVKSLNDLDGLITEIGAEIERMSGPAQCSVRKVQAVASSLTRLQLTLNELERIEVQYRGASREMANQFAVLEGRIRMMWNALNRAGRGRMEEHAHDPAR